MIEFTETARERRNRVMKAYYAKNREKLLAQAAAKYASHKNEIKAYRKEHAHYYKWAARTTYVKHREARIASAKAYYEAHKGRICEYQALYRATHRDQARAHYQAWYRATHRDQARAHYEAQKEKMKEEKKDISASMD